MNNMKRLIAVMMVLVIAVCFAACGGTEPTKAPTTTTPTTAPTTQPTTAPTTQPTKAEPGYIVYVVDQDGLPVGGATVLLCDEGMCYAPVVTNAEGAAEFSQKNLVGAKAKIAAITGYTIDNPDYTMIAEGENTVTLTVTKAA